MDERTDIVDPLEHAGWDDWVLSCPTSTIFHTTAWARVLVEAFRYRPIYMCRMAGDKPTACLPVMEMDSFLTPRKAKALPFTDFCDVIAEGDPPTDLLLDAALEYGRTRGWTTLELRGGTIDESAPHVGTCYGHTVSLAPGPDEVFSSFQSSTRRNIKRAQKQGVRVRHEHSFQAVRDYYRLHVITRKRHGLFVQPFALFRNIFEHIVARGHGFVVLAALGERPVAGALYFHSRDRGVFAYGASDKAYQHLRPNNLVMWHAIQWFGEHGYTVLDLGITDASNRGLRRYKNGMATDERVLHYYKYSFGSQQFLAEPGATMRSLRTAMCRHMPLWLLRGVGTLLYKHHG